jgi:hypothetical protein
LKPPDPMRNGGPVSETAARVEKPAKVPDVSGELVNESDLEDIALEESRDLVRLEKVIEGGLQTFVEVGAALAEIRDRRLYRIEHKTFEAYCRDKWNIGRTYAHRLMASNDTVEMLPVGNKPTSERQVRPLTKLPKEKRAEAWQRAVEASPSGQPTAADVEAAVEEVAVVPATRTPRVVIDAAERIWAVAKGHLDKIIDQDASLVRVMDEVIAYCESRKAALSARRIKQSKGKARRLTFTLEGRLIESVPWSDGDVWQHPTIAVMATSNADLKSTLKLMAPTTLANKVWKASTEQA